MSNVALPKSKVKELSAPSFIPGVAGGAAVQGAKTLLSSPVGKAAVTATGKVGGTLASKAWRILRFPFMTGTGIFGTQAATQVLDQKNKNFEHSVAEQSDVLEAVLKSGQGKTNGIPRASLGRGDKVSESIEERLKYLESLGGRPPTTEEGLVYLNRMREGLPVEAETSREDPSKPPPKGEYDGNPAGYQEQGSPQTQHRVTKKKRNPGIHGLVADPNGAY